MPHRYFDSLSVEDNVPSSKEIRSARHHLTLEEAGGPSAVFHQVMSWLRCEASHKNVPSALFSPTAWKNIIARNSISGLPRQVNVWQT